MTLALTGPGRYSLDRILGIRLPRWMAAMAWISVIGATVAALQRPEIAEKVAETVIPGTFSSTSDPNLEVETRPRAAAEQVEEPAWSSLYLARSDRSASALSG